RELYTDAEEVIFAAQRPVMFNAIEDVAVNGDIIDRSIRLILPEIPDTERQSEDTFWQAFEHARPAILGAVLTAVATALRNRPNVTLERLPRMADFALWVVAAEPALGWKPGTFIAAYEQNRMAANELALAASLVAQAILKLVERGPWEGTA